jgi:hypothetical protein
MQRDPHVDRALGELWAISDEFQRTVRDGLAQLEAEVAHWQPAPMPDDYIPKKGDCT